MRFLLFTVAILMFICIAVSFASYVSYDSNVCIEPENGINYSVCRTLTVEFDGYTFIIPKGFKTDLASIPRFFWPAYSPMDANSVRPSIAHDYLYTCDEFLSRKAIDDIYYHLLVYEGMPRPRAFIYWLTVRIFGGSHFYPTKRDICSVG